MMLACMTDAYLGMLTFAIFHMIRHLGKYTVPKDILTKRDFRTGVERYLVVEELNVHKRLFAKIVSFCLYIGYVGC